MWSMVRLARGVQYQTDYILETDRCIFRNVSISNLRFNLDHHMVLGCLYSAPLREYTKYLGQSICPPLWLPIALRREDGLFMALQRSTLLRRLGHSINASMKGYRRRRT